MMSKFSFEEVMRSIATPHPARDWSIALVIIVMTFVGFVAYAGYLFVGIRWGGLTGESSIQSVSPPTITRGELDSALETYRVRRANFESRNFGIPGVTDPR